MSDPDLTQIAKTEAHIRTCAISVLWVRIATHISAITNRYSDGSVGVVHSAVCGSSKFNGAKTCFEKAGVVLQRPNAIL